MGFDVEVRKQIHSCFAAVSSTDVWLQRDVTLPFAPYAGLSLKDGDWYADLTEVLYDVQRGVFSAYVESDGRHKEGTRLHRPHRRVEAPTRDIDHTPA